MSTLNGDRHEGDSLWHTSQTEEPFFGEKAEGEAIAEASEQRSLIGLRGP
jgi:hypothetical protein